jgi:multicomponent Na+:H+ antiporter subunit E
LIAAGQGLSRTSCFQEMLPTDREGNLMNSSERSIQRTKSARPQDVLARLLIFSLFWGILIGADWQGWLFGIPVILTASLLSLALAPRLCLAFRPLSLLRFLGHFVRYAISGGWDVSLRALNPKLPICPGLVYYRFQMPPGGWRVFLVNVTSLLPGTLSSELQDEGYIIHVLDSSQPVLEQIARLEELVSDLFGIQLPAPEQQA